MKQVIHLARSYRNPSHWLKNITWRCPSTVSDIKCIFVVGSPRSGTTLLQRVLSSHSRLFSIPGETGLFSYQNIFGRHHFGLPEDELQQLYLTCGDIVEFFAKCVDLRARENIGSQFVEKTPQHVLHVEFLKKHFPNARIINIVRDGRDCYCSSRSHPNIPQNQSVRKFARYWQKCIRTAILAKDAERIHTIRYEDFCAEPWSTLHETMQFLGLENESQQLEVTEIQNDPRASVQHFRRLNESVNGSSTGRWRKELTEEEAREFERIAGVELCDYGYGLLG